MFSEDRVVCLGSQLKHIVENLSRLIDPHVWFCADIEAISSIPTELGLDSPRLRKIGNDISLTNLCANIDQFLAGVFIAVKEEDQNLESLDVHAWTEDEQFRSLHLDGGIIEIRTFDTSYFELYSDDSGLMEKLSLIYRAEVECLKS